MQTSSDLVRRRSVLAGYSLALLAFGCEARLAVSEPIADDTDTDIAHGGEGNVPLDSDAGLPSGNGGDGGTTVAACDDEVLNGDETGLDCGGSCDPCPTNTCNCASSPSLSAISCDETFGRVEYSEVSALTPDGQTGLVSVSYAVPASGTVWRTFRWTASGDLTPLGDVAPMGISDDGQNALLRTINGDVSFVAGSEPALAVPLLLESVLSADGSQVVGPARSNENALARWTPGGGLEVIEDQLPGLWRVAALTADASTVVGHRSTDDGSVPFRWTAAGGVSDLGALPANANGAKPLALSSDGAVIAGVTLQGSQVRDLFRWTEESGITVIAPALDIAAGVSMFLSADGSVVAANSPDHGFGFRWTAADGASELINGQSSVKGMSPDGAIVLGSGSYSGFLWTPTEVTDFSDVLATRGVDLSGWVLGEPHRMTTDGSVVFGRGTCGGVEVTYRLNLAD